MPSMREFWLRAAWSAGSLLPVHERSPDSSPTGSNIVRFIKRRWVWIVIAGSVLVGLHVAPLLVTHPEQDACSFGPVSNETYRNLLHEARQKQATSWPSLPWDDRK